MSIKFPNEYPDRYMINGKDCVTGIKPEDYWDAFVPKKLVNKNKKYNIKKIPSNYKEIIPLVYIGRLGSGSYTTFKFISNLIHHIYKKAVEIIMINTTIGKISETMIDDLNKIITHSEKLIKIIYIPSYVESDIIKPILTILKDKYGLFFLFISVYCLEKEHKTIKKSTGEEIYKYGYISIPNEILKSVKLHFIKSYYNKLDYYFDIYDKEITNFLKKIDYETQINQNYQFRKFGILLNSKKEVRRIVIPYIDESKFDISKV